MMSTVLSLEERTQELDRWVASRSARAPLALKKYLKDYSHLPACRRFVLEGYRKLSLYRQGYQLTQHFPASAETKLWKIRFLNLMGASHYALAELGKVRPRGAASFKTYAQIYLSNGCYAQALELFEKLQGSETLEDLALRDPLLLLSKADALAGMGDFEAAHGAAGLCAARTSKPINQSIAWQAQGEYAARQGEFAQAQELLSRAESLLPPADPSVDRIFLQKWKFYVEGRLGSAEEAAQRLRFLVEELRQRFWRDELWYLCYGLVEKLGQLTAEESLRLSLYPGIEEGLRGGISACLGKFSGREFFDPRALVEIDLSAGEFLCGEKRSFCLSKELHLAALLKVMGPWGLGIYKSASLLWPEQPFDLPFLHARLDQLRKRLKSVWGLATYVQGPRVFLDPGSESKISVIYSPVEVRPAFLTTVSDFSAADLQQAYGMSVGSRHSLLRSWFAKGWIERVGKSKNTRYRVL